MSETHDTKRCRREMNYHARMAAQHVLDGDLDEARESAEQFRLARTAWAHAAAGSPRAAGLPRDFDVLAEI